MSEQTATIDKPERIGKPILSGLKSYMGYDAFVCVVRSADSDFILCVIQTNEDEGFVSDSPYDYCYVLSMFIDKEKIYEATQGNNTMRSKRQ